MELLACSRLLDEPSRSIDFLNAVSGIPPHLHLFKMSTCHLYNQGGVSDSGGILDEVGGSVIICTPM